jgi:hypothetical protein
MTLSTHTVVVCYAGNAGHNLERSFDPATGTATV